jgi:hypothetical protein
MNQMISFAGIQYQCSSLLTAWFIMFADGKFGEETTIQNAKLGKQATCPTIHHDESYLPLYIVCGPTLLLNSVIRESRTLVVGGLLFCCFVHV